MIKNFFLKTKKSHFKPKYFFSISLGAAFLISQPVNKVFSNPVTVTVNGTSYTLGATSFTNFSDDLSVMQNQPWWGDSSTAISFTNAAALNLKLTPGSPYGPAFNYATPQTNLFSYHLTNRSGDLHSNDTGYNCYTGSCQGYAYVVITDDGDATYSITGQTYAGKTLTAGVSSNDPDGNGTVTSYTWQSSSDGSSWSNISGATSSTFTVTSSEEGKALKTLGCLFVQKLKQKA